MTRCAAVLLFASCALAALADPLETVAERTGYRTTGRYEEVAALCRAFRKAHPAAVRCLEFGRTPEGRPMLALAASRSGALTAAEARKRGVPVVLIQGGIHAGEIDGKDAGFLALREALEGRAAMGALERQVLLFVPVLNVDGHERFGRWNRPNQRGPEEMGWRTTAQNLNLNRDYGKADAPEIQALLRLANEWDPIASVDLHVTDGAKFEHDVAILVEPVNAGDGELRAVGRRWRDAVIAELAAQGSAPLAFYPSFVASDDPASGFADGVAPAALSHGYYYLRNRLGMLVETHSWKDYPTRVRVTRNVVVSVLGQIAAHGREWLAVARAADARSARLAGREVPLGHQAADAARTIDIRGYAYVREPSDVSGALMTRYDETRPQVWKVPLRDVVVPGLQVTAPRGGYLVPAAHARAVAAKLDHHAISYRKLRSPLKGAPLEVFRAAKATAAAKPFEGRQRLTLEGEWKPETRDLAAGALFVPIEQPKARLVIALLEPRSWDSLVAWGAFNAAFEEKEYLEDYVAEDVAREQLAADPALAAEFRRKVADDPEFAKSPAERLRFFYRRHSSWDERFNLYPVMRTATVP